MSRIKSVHALEILDSRGNPTVRCFVTLENGIAGIASVPSGASTGIHEALELRDGDKKRYGGKGVRKAVEKVNGLIGKMVNGLNVFDQQKIDRALIELDGTKNKSKLGANAILAVSLASARAGAIATKVPLYDYIRSTYKLPITNYKLPIPTMNVLNGGRHADWASDIQEFMIIPLQKKFSERIRCGAEIFAALRGVLKTRGYEVGVGDEGGYAPRLKNNEEAFKLLALAVEKAGYNRPGTVRLGIDAAASEFYNPDTKQYELKCDRKKISADELAKLYMRWMRRYPLVSIEDPFAEDDWNAWQVFQSQISRSTSDRKPEILNLKSKIVVGDDLFVTNTERLQKGIALGAANAILVKLNQIGTLTETMETIALARAHDYKVIISHRSGETCDTFIADLAVAVNADFIKTGSLSRSERTEKYNRLMEIEQELL